MNRLVLPLVATTLLASTGFAQESRPASEAMTLFREAYGITRAARTEEDFSKIIDLCQQGMERPLNESDEKYGRSLMAWAHNRRGELRAEAGQEDQALADFESSVQLDPSRYGAYHNRGVSYGLAGRYEEALADFNRVLKLKPDHSKAWFNRGELRFNQGDLAGALADYNQCLRNAPNDSQALNSRGFVYYTQRNYRAALQDYNRAIQVDGANAEAYTNRGDCQAALGQYAAAVRDYQSAVRANSRFGRAYQSSAWLRATCPDPQIRNAELAVKSVQRAIELDGDGDYRYLDTLAAAQAAAGDFEAAKEAIAKGLALAEEAKAPDDLLSAMRDRQALYLEGKPYREATAAVSAQPRPRGR
jgi:tetratricopeptide (TPR) repeat protein